jgi:hypothetical protein
MSSPVEIANRALQKLGAKRISAFTDGTNNARAVQTCYDALRLAELRKHRWSFAIRRHSLAAAAVAPSFGYQNSFLLPTGYVKLIDPDPNWNYVGTRGGTIVGNNTQSLDEFSQYAIEGGYILSDATAPLNIRCIMNIEDCNLMDPLFREALAAKMAEEMCEEITQSNAKKESARTDYKEAIADAKKANGIELPPQQPPLDCFITARL